MSGVVITVKLKLDWQDALAFDRELSHLAFRVAYAIGWHFNRHSGDAHVGRHTIAEKLGVCVRAVEKAITELQARGHLEVERNWIGTDAKGRPVHGGRGRSNLYRPAFKRANGGAPILQHPPDETANERAPKTEPERANERTEKGERNDPKGRTGVRPNPNITQKITPTEQVEGQPVLRMENAARFRVSTRNANRLGQDGQMTFKDRGQYELRLGELLGWETLDRLSEQRIAALCRRLRNDALTDADVADARLSVVAAATASRPG